MSDGAALARKSMMPKLLTPKLMVLLLRHCSAVYVGGGRAATRLMAMRECGLLTTLAPPIADLSVAFLPRLKNCSSMLLVALSRGALWLSSGLLLSALSARAEAPSPSQDFWNYMVEFGDTQGELFDPADYSAIADLPASASRDQQPAMEKIPPATYAAPPSPIAPVIQESLP